MAACLCAAAADEPALSPFSVCDALADFPSHEGKPVALLGRYLFRKNGRWLDQEQCAATKQRAAVLLAADQKSAPMPPEPMVFDENALEEEMKIVKQHTALEKFRFGSEDYDRWAVVYGRLESSRGHEARLVYRGDGAIFFLTGK